MLRWNRSRITDRVDELIDLVGLDRDMLDRYPDELSGGQQQRVGVARALAADPPVLLMDEPFGAVDPIVRSRLQDELLALQQRVHKTIVIVTHDLDEALRVADRVAVLNVGGILEQLAAPDDLMRSPATPFVEEFVGADRSVRRLGLSTVADVAYHRGPVVDIDDEPADGIKVMEREGVEWLGVLDNGAFAGWIIGSDVRRADLSGAKLSDQKRDAAIAHVTPNDSLRSAMDMIMVSNTSVAVINDGGRFGGVVTLEDLRRTLAAT